MTEEVPAVQPRHVAWWLRDRVKFWSSITVAAAGAVLTGLQFAPEAWRPGWLTAILFTALLGGGVHMAVVAQKDARDEGSLRQQAAAGREIGYSEATAKLRRHIAKMRTRISDGVGPESADELRDSSIDLARELLAGVGVPDARVSYYTPADGEQEPGSTGGGDYSELRRAYSSYGDGRHLPKEAHVWNARTAKMFEAMMASAPVMKTRSLKGVDRWKTALFMGVRVDERPRGLVCADSLRRKPFPSAAHDLVQLIAELLLLAEFATTNDTSD